LVGWIRGASFSDGHRWCPFVDFGVTATGGQCRFGRLIRIYRTGLECNSTNVALLDAPWKAGAVLLLYIVIQQFESLVLVPLIMKQR